MLAHGINQSELSSGHVAKDVQTFLKSPIFVSKLKSYKQVSSEATFNSSADKVNCSRINEILLMEEIPNNHLGCKKPCK